MSGGKNDNFQQNRNDLSASDALKQYTGGQTLTTVAMIAGPVSLIIGGVLLSAVAIVCAYLAYRKLSAVAQGNSTYTKVAASMQKTARVAIIIGAVALVLNFISMMYVLPMVMEMMNTGEVSTNLFGGSTTTGTAGSTSSTWG